MHQHSHRSLADTELLGSLKLLTLQGGASQPGLQNFKHLAFARSFQLLLQH